MATKVEKRAKPAKSPAAAPANELEVLHPERILVVGGERVTMREYGHVEWLRLLPTAAPLVDAIAALLEADRDPSYEEALDIVARHIDRVLPLVLQACGMTAEAFDKLKPDDGELLLMTWWGCNGRFFVQRAINRVVVRSQERQVLAGRGTARSTPPSSPTATPEVTSTPTPSAS
jgi:hypothetical protein